MAARSIWKGAISFGMVSIPVALFSAAQSKDLSFNMLHKKCGSRVKQQYISAMDNDEVVPRDEQPAVPTGDDGLFGLRHRRVA